MKILINMNNNKYNINFCDKRYPKITFHDQNTLNMKLDLSKIKEQILEKYKKSLVQNPNLNKINFMIDESEKIINDFEKEKLKNITELYKNVIHESFNNSNINLKNKIEQNIYEKLIDKIKYSEKNDFEYGIEYSSSERLKLSECVHIENNLKQIINNNDKYKIYDVYPNLKCVVSKNYNNWEKYFIELNYKIKMNQENK